MNEWINEWQTMLILLENRYVAIMKWKRNVKYVKYEQLKVCVKIHVVFNTKINKNKMLVTDSYFI